MLWDVRGKRRFLVACAVVLYMIWCIYLGGGEAVCSWRPAMWWVPRCTLRRQVCTILLCQRHMPAVLLRAVLGADSLEARPWVPQTTCQGRSWSTEVATVPLVLRLSAHHTEHTSIVLQFISICYFTGFSMVFSIFIVEKFNILYCLAFQWPFQWLFYSLNCSKVEFFLVKMCIICTPSACWFALHW